MSDEELEANRARTRAFIKRLEADPAWVEQALRGIAEMDAGLYYAWDPENGDHTDLDHAVDGCECLACRKYTA